MAADRKIGGFNGSWGSGCAVDRKRALLLEEGVHFDGGLVATESLHVFDSAPQSKAKKRRRESDA